ncbi:MAG: CPBP family intramembrane metalloprotease [Thermoplasmata archaeon]|nr:CPBP family intramembrane metalloprotease [Thermoplasmata archaeon]
MPAREARRAYSMGLQGQDVHDRRSDVAPLPAYLTAVAITVVAILSQYFLPQSVPALRPLYSTLLTTLLIVYGLPIVAFLVLVGRRPLLNFFSNPGSAVVQGLRWYGLMSILGLIAAFAIIAAVASLDPTALPQLNKPNPALTEAASNPWFWVAFSFVIGIVEETIFRGWIFGYWLVRRPSQWVVHAAWTSVLFAGVHFYYGKTYGLTSGVAFAELFFAGLAFSFAVRHSGGNLLGVGLLHGLHDALIFSTLLSQRLGTDLYYLLILVGALVALVVFLRGRPRGPITPGLPGFVSLRDAPQGNPAIVWPPERAVDPPPLPSPMPPRGPGPPTTR